MPDPSSAAVTVSLVWNVYVISSIELSNLTPGAKETVEGLSAKEERFIEKLTTALDAVFDFGIYPIPSASETKELLSWAVPRNDSFKEKLAISPL
jgi:hypothetical protein